MNRRQFLNQVIKPAATASIPLFLGLSAFDVLAKDKFNPNKVSQKTVSPGGFGITRPAIGGGQANRLDSMAGELHEREPSPAIKAADDRHVSVVVSYGGTSTLKLAYANGMMYGQKNMCVPIISGPLLMNLRGIDYPVPIENVWVAGSTLYLNLSTEERITSLHFKIDSADVNGWAIAGTSARVRVEMEENGERMRILIGLDGRKPLFEQAFVRVPDSSIILWIPADSRSPFQASQPELLPDPISVPLSVPSS